MENLLALFQESINHLHVSKKTRLLLAVSGGMDSVVLTTLASRSGLDFGIAHANFQLRGSESERDEDFCRTLAEQYRSPFFINRFDTTAYAQKEKLSIQVAARKLRYEWFKSLTGNGPGNYQWIITAHHQDDQIETLLMHFFRGTGIMGLGGIPVRNEKILRPLLGFSKSQLKQFALDENLRWVEDSSNASDDYTRNYFRNQLIPSLKPIFPEVIQNLEKNLQRFSEAGDVYQQAIRMHKKKLLRESGKEIHIPILLLKKTLPLKTILFEILKDFDFSPSQTEEVIRLMDSENGKYITSPSCRIIKNRKWLVVAPLQETDVAHQVVEIKDSEMRFPEGLLRFQITNNQDADFISGESATAFLDYDKIRFPLLLRKWKSGDYFYPLGMKKKKKLSRFFIDQKLSKTAKEKVWVLVMDNHIIWVVGMRIDNRFAVTSQTQSILKIKNADA